MDIIWIIAEFLPIMQHRWLIVSIGPHPSLVTMDELLVIGDAIDNHPLLAVCILRCISSGEVMPCQDACIRLVTSASRMGVYIAHLTEYPRVNDTYIEMVSKDPMKCIEASKKYRTDVPPALIEFMDNSTLSQIFGNFTERNKYERWWLRVFIRLSESHPECIAKIIDDGYDPSLSHITDEVVMHLKRVSSFGRLFRIHERNVTDARAKLKRVDGVLQKKMTPQDELIKLISTTPAYFDSGAAATTNILSTFNLTTPQDIAMIPERYPYLYEVMVARYNNPSEENQPHGDGTLPEFLDLLLYATATSPRISNSWIPHLVGLANFGAADRVFLAKMVMKHLHDTGEMPSRAMMANAVRSSENDAERERYIQLFSDGVFPMLTDV